MDALTPGQMVSGLIVILGAALVVLLFSLNRHIKRVRFPENTDN